MRAARHWLRWVGPLCGSAVALLAQDSLPDLRSEREIFVRGGVSAALAWSSDGKWIASGGTLGEVLLVDAASGTLKHEWLVDSRGIGRLVFAPAAPLLAVVADDVSLWTPAAVRVAKWPAGSRRAFAWRADVAKIIITS